MVVLETILQGVIAFLLGTLNLRDRSQAKYVAENTDERKRANFYAKKNIEVNQRQNKKLDWLMKKSGADVDAFNIILEREVNGDLEEEFEEYLNGGADEL